MGTTQAKNHLGLRIKEFRLGAGLTQEALAQKTGIPYTTLIKVESGAIKNPSIKVITSIARTLGVPVEELTNDEGIVQTIEGQDNIEKILDDVYETLKDSGGEVFISGIDERKFLEADKEAITAHIGRLSKAGVKERLLARDGDSFFFAGSQSVYRWVPENLFNPTPIYVYGEKVAMIVWGLHQQVIIIRNPVLADAYRKQFLFIWERAKIPPSKKVSEDERKRLEQAIIKRFGGRVSSTTDKDKKIFRDLLVAEKIKTYANSFYYLGQAANGTGEQKLGLKFFDGEMLAPIGIFNRVSLGGGWHFHIIHPIGNFDVRKITTLAKSMLELSGNPVFVKKVSTEQREKLLNAGFSQVETYPWHAQAIEEDDTFPEQVLDIEKTIVNAEGPGKRDLKDKYRRFIFKYEKDVTAQDLSEANAKNAIEIVKKFFDYLEIKELHISQPTDYDNIIHHPPLGKNGRAYFSQVLYLKNSPVAFFAAEPISKDSVGLFANITLHQEIPYLSEYLIVYICKLLKQVGYKFLNLGGSETGGLFQFKDKFSPVEYNKMHWVVYKFS